jgi:hypothetical protein
MNTKRSKLLLALSALFVAMLACSLPGSGALFEDDFEGDTTAWGTGTDADSSVEYADGGLQMQIYIENYMIWSTPDAEPFENIHVEVTVKNNNTDPYTAFGIICYAQDYVDTFYYLAITPNGDYVIADKTLALDSVYLTNDGAWATSDLITPNKESYRLGADCGNGTLTLYVDGQLIDSATDDSYTSGNIGLLAWSDVEVNNVDVTFDDIVVTELK